jgi:hypothetical protein
VTKLEAVQTMLRAIGYNAALTALDTGGTSVAAVAEAILDDQTERLQKNGPGSQNKYDGAIMTGGWWFNTYFNQTETPDGSGYIDLTGVLAVKPYSPPGAQYDIDEVNDRLYDRTNSTDVFAGDVVLHEVKLIAWTSLPESFQEYVMRTAAEELAEQRDVGDRLVGATIRRRREASARVHREHSNYAGINIFATPGSSFLHGNRRNTLLRG